MVSYGALTTTKPHDPNVPSDPNVARLPSHLQPSRKVSNLTQTSSTPLPPRGAGNHGLENVNGSTSGRSGMSYRNTIYDFASHRAGAEDGDGWEGACAARRQQLRHDPSGAKVSDWGVCCHCYDFPLLSITRSGSCSCVDALHTRRDTNSRCVLLVPPPALFNPSKSTPQQTTILKMRRVIWMPPHAKLAIGRADETNQKLARFIEESRAFFKDECANIPTIATYQLTRPLTPHLCREVRAATTLSRAPYMYCHRFEVAHTGARRFHSLNHTPSLPRSLAPTRPGRQCDSTVEEVVQQANSLTNLMKTAAQHEHRGATEEPRAHSPHVLAGWSHAAPAAAPAVAPSSLPSALPTEARAVYELVKTSNGTGHCTIRWKKECAEQHVTVDGFHFGGASVVRRKVELVLAFLT